MRTSQAESPWSSTKGERENPCKGLSDRLLADVVGVGLRAKGLLRP